MKDCPNCKKKGRKKCWCGQEPKDLKMKKTKKSLKMKKTITDMPPKGSKSYTYSPESSEEKKPKSYIKRTTRRVKNKPKRRGGNAGPSSYGAIMK